MKKLLLASVLVLVLFSYSLLNPNSIYAVVSGQIILENNRMVYNRDSNGDGKKDPFMGVGPGDPENFFYRSDWQNIRDGIKNSGSNTMYAIIVAGWNGRGDSPPGSHPFTTETGTTLDAAKLNDIYTRLKSLSDNGIVTWVFLYDDAMCVFASCTSFTVPAAEEAFIQAVVDKMEQIPLVIFVVAEEYQEAFGVGSQRVRNIAAKIKQYDANKHIVGVHHATGDNTFDFSGDANIDQFSHQPSPISMADLHADVLTAINSAGGNHHVAMTEASPYHHNLLIAQNRTELRQSNWAVAMTGVPSLVLCTYRTDSGCPAPTADMLNDWGRTVKFFESTNFNEMAANDALKSGSTQYVLAKQGDGYIVYATTSVNPGITGLTAGTYNFKWMDTVTGTIVNQSNISVGSGTQSWTRPSGIGNEAALYLKKTLGTTPSLSVPVSSPSTTIVPTLPSGTISLSLSLFLHGIGNGGDNVNPTSLGTMNPLHQTRSVTLDITDTQNQTASLQGSVAFNSSAGNFQGTVDAAGLATGSYTVKVISPQYLRKTIPGIIQITAGQTKVLPQAALTTGDANSDNLLNILDYNFILDCYADLSAPRNCADPQKKLMTDITDDGSVNQFDYNLFLRELSVQSGQ